MSIDPRLGAWSTYRPAAKAPRLFAPLGSGYAYPDDMYWESVDKPSTVFFSGECCFAAVAP